MQKVCEGCGRSWRVDAPEAPLALLRCPYPDCRCSFVLQPQANGQLLERARVFFRRRAIALRWQFDADSHEAKADYFLGAMLLTVLLSLLGVSRWVGAGWAFFLSLSLAPLVMVLALEQPRGALAALGWLYAVASLLVISALTPSPLAFALMLPRLVLPGLTALFIIVVSGVFGGFFYGGLRYVSAARYARLLLRQEKSRLPRVEATLAGLPYR